MMAKTFAEGSSFRRICLYVTQNRERAVVLHAEGVRAHDHVLMAKDFETIHSLHQSWRKPVFHGVIDFHPTEHVDDAKKIEIAQKFLREMNLTNTQYAVVRHTDTNHDHVHLVANLIDYEGKQLSVYPKLLKINDITNKLAAEYDLMPVGKKNLRQTNFEALSRSETRKYAIYRSVGECLPGCRDLEELEQRLRKQDIDVRFRTDPETGHKIGISFRYQNEAFRGRDIDRDHSLGQIQKRLGQQQQLSQWTSEKLVQGQELERQAKQENEQLQRQQQKERELAREETLRQNLSHTRGRRI